MLIYYIRDIILCFIATWTYCIIMSLPKRSFAISSLCASLTYFIYRIIHLEAGREMLGYLIAALFASCMSELFARKFKMPTTIFVFPAIIPLVPGLGLYRSMLCLVNSDIGGFTNEAVKTLFISGIVAVTVAVVNATFRSLSSKSSDQKIRFASMRHK